MKFLKLIFSVLLIVLLSVSQTAGVYAQVASSQRLGGMNLNGYCNSLNEGGSTLNGNTWECESGQPIDMNAACQWQYADTTATAIEEDPSNPFTWACYTNSSSVTPTATPAPATPTVSPTPTSTPASSSGTTTVVFDDALASGWVDASYNATNTIVTTPVNTGTRAISSTLQQDGGFDLQSINGFQTSSTTVLHFMLRASQANQRYEVYADTQYGQPLAAPVSLSNYGGQPMSTMWMSYDIPLSDLNASNVSLRDIVIHDASSSNQPAVYIDQIELRSSTTSVTPTMTPLPATTLAPTPTVAPTQTPTQAPSAPTPTPTPSGSGNTLVLFGDALASGWTDASYNTTNAIVSSPVGSGSAAIASTIQSDGGFDLQSINGQMASSTTVLHVMLRASQANQRYEVYADTQYGQPLAAPVSLSNYGGQPMSTMWMSYDIPLSDLNATNVSLRDVVIHDATSSNQGVLYIDQVELRSVTSTPTATPTPTPAVTITPTPASSSGGSTREVRKSIYDLTPAELQRLDNAFNTIRANGVYQDFMNRHMQAMMTLTQPDDPTTQRNVAHRGPSFLPWHRELLLEFEKALQTADPTVTLPYWPFEQDAATANTGTLPRVFSAAYFGGDGNPAQNNRVTDGPFASWGITRMVGRDPGGQPTLPTQAEVNALMQYSNYDSAPYSETSSGFRNAIEGWIGPEGQWSMHNRVHAYVGGDMLPETSMSSNVANDPIFWLVHANIDRIWWEWQQTHGVNNYQPVSGGPTGHNLNDVMQFLNGNITPADVLDTNSLGYTYQ